MYVSRMAEKVDNKSNVSSVSCNMKTDQTSMEINEDKKEVDHKMATASSSSSEPPPSHHCSSSTASTTTMLEQASQSQIASTSLPVMSSPETTAIASYSATTSRDGCTGVHVHSTQDVTSKPITSTAIDAANLIANKQKLPQPDNLRRVMNPPKLERKHSSGDLHSRLKTRKILGVGETDNGDIHRSKISQVLGHNEHLYVKFPMGLWSWGCFLSGLLLVQALLILFFPRQACQLKLLGIQQEQEKEGLMMASKYYAVSLLALSFILWRFMYIRDKGVARTVQLGALVHFSSLCAVDLIAAATTGITQLFDTALLAVIGIRMGTVLICSIYLSRIGTATSGLRRSPSHRDLGETVKKDG